MAESAEVEIVGGGIIGASVAYHLAARGVEGVVSAAKAKPFWKVKIL